MHASELISYHVSPPASPTGLNRLNLYNLGCLGRYLHLWIRYPQLRASLFSVDRGYDIRVMPQADVRIGRSVLIMRDFSAYFQGRVSIGNHVYFNRGCTVAVYNSLEIGDNSIFGERVSIHDENHVIGCGSEPIASRGWETAPIVIGKNVWVGSKATILQGVRIGDNAVVGANAVVTRDIPANSVAAGIPARVIRTIDTQ